MVVVACPEPVVVTGCVVVVVTVPVEAVVLGCVVAVVVVVVVCAPLPDEAAVVVVPSLVVCALEQAITEPVVAERSARERTTETK